MGKKLTVTFDVNQMIKHIKSRKENFSEIESNDLSGIVNGIEQLERHFYGTPDGESMGKVGFMFSELQEVIDEIVLENEENEDE